MNSKFLSTSLLAAALFAGLGMVPVMAQYGGYRQGDEQARQGEPYTPGIDQGQHTISVRIHKGQASGRITPSEAQVLYQREREISARVNRFKADGHVSYQERLQLRTDFDSLNAEVDRMLNSSDRMPRSDNTPGIDRSQRQISQRIDEAVRLGRLNEYEAQKLRRRGYEIERREAYFKSDGVATPLERQRLRDELAALNGELDRMMYDPQSRRYDDFHRDGR